MLSGGLAVAQQQPTRGTVPKTVRVFVLVSTASGQPVTDLDARDFSLWDNNVQKTITSFRFVRMNSDRLPRTSYVSAEPQNDRDHDVVAYEMTFDAAPGKRPDEYHELGVRVDRPKLNVLARQGYYAQP
jgi:hypothetical protein